MAGQELVCGRAQREPVLRLGESLLASASPRLHGGYRLDVAPAT